MGLAVSMALACMARVNAFQQGGESIEYESRTCPAENGRDL